MRCCLRGVAIVCIIGERYAAQSEHNLLTFALLPACMSHFPNAEVRVHVLGSVTMKTSFDKNAYVPGETAQARLKLMSMNYV